jgi:hypothetical protein
MQEVRTLKLGSQELELRLNQRAAEALQQETDPLYIEMELYFSCLVGKRVNFLRDMRPGSVIPSRLSNNVSIGFRAMMMRTCQPGSGGSEPEAGSFLAERGERYVPRWISLDYRAGQWSGEFGLK